MCHNKERAEFFIITDIYDEDTSNYDEMNTGPYESENRHLLLLSKPDDFTRLSEISSPTTISTCMILRKIVIRSLTMLVSLNI